MNFYDENSTYELMENYEDEFGDIMYLKELYPKSFLRLQRIIDEECDKLEFDGSIMFDEFPDKERLRMLEDGIFELTKNKLMEELSTNQNQRGLPSDDWLKDIMCALLISEMMRRRSRRRIARRGFC